MDNYKNKYLKYKNKYYNLKEKKMSGGNMYAVLGSVSLIALILSVIYYMRKKLVKDNNKNDPNVTYDSVAPPKTVAPTPPKTVAQPELALTLTLNNN